jgi:hypothetical protein
MINKGYKISLVAVALLILMLSLGSCAAVREITMTPAAITVTAISPAQTVTSTLTSMVTTTGAPVTVTTTAPAVTVTTTVPTTAVIQSNMPVTGPITITGYLTTEDDFAANLGMDTAMMVHMRKMAASGLGITRQRADGKWEFYFFSGTITAGTPTTGWVFNGTGAQLDAWNIVTTAAAGMGSMSPVKITVVGTLKGDTTTNPGSDADGLYFPIITVTSITLAS